MAILVLVVCTAVPAMSQMGRVPAGFVAPGTPVPSPVPANGKAPRIKFVSILHDFGQVDEGPEVTHLFRFRNVGRAPLKIGDVHASCGCTAAVATTSEIPPGGVGAIKATYHTQGRPGKAVKNITVNCNDPRSPTLSLTFNVEVTREIDLQPDRVYFFGVKQGQSRTVTLTVLGKPMRHLKISDVTVRDKKVQVASAPMSQKSGDANGGMRYGATFVVTLPDNIPIGEISDEIAFKTNDLKKPEVKIPVNGEVVGRVQTFPKTIFMNDLTQPQTITISVDPPEGFAVRNVSTEKKLVKPWVRSVVQPNGTKQYSVVVSPPNPKSIPPGEFTDTLILTTNDPKQGKFLIPVKGNRPNN
jgi:hypothetical protein